MCFIIGWHLIFSGASWTFSGTLTYFVVLFKISFSMFEKFRSFGTGILSIYAAFWVNWFLIFINFVSKISSLLSFLIANLIKSRYRRFSSSKTWTFCRRSNFLTILNCSGILKMSFISGVESWFSLVFTNLVKTLISSFNCWNFSVIIFNLSS